MGNTPVSLRGAISSDCLSLRYFEDDSIATWVQRHMWIILLSAFGVILMLLLTWRWHYMRGIRRMDIPRGSKFCQNNPRECIRNRFFKSVLYDYRRTRDTQLDPGRRQTAIKAGSTMRDYCRMPVKLLYVDPRIRQWWGHMLPGQERGLVQCPTPCVVVEDESSGEADVLVSMFRSEGRGRVRGQKTAVVNMEAHSIDYDAMAGADLFVSFHKEADVRVNYAYALKHGVPCDKPAHDCLLSAVAESVRREGPLAAAVERLPSDGSQSAVGVGNKASAGGRSRKGAVLFMSASCDRHGGFVRELVRLLRGDGGMGIDSFGKCFHDHSEAADPLFVQGR